MVTIQEIFFKNYQKTARRWESWYGRGEMNLEIADFLLKKYNSSHKRLLLSANEFVNLDIEERTNRIINPHHLHLHSYILMFFGLSLECYLKGCLIKKGKEPISEDKNGVPYLDKYFSTHDLLTYFKEAFNKKPELEIEETLENLRRCIISGKYPVERSAHNGVTLTANFDRDIKNAKCIIKSLTRMP